MAQFFLSRGWQSIVSLLGVTALIFFLQRLTGDPVMLMMPEGASDAAIQQMREQLGFDRPVWVQFLEYLRSAFSFDFGTSLVQKVPVWDIIASRMPYTLYLAGVSLAIAMGVGLPLGVWMAVRRDSWLSKAGLGVVLAGQSIPTFWSGVLLILGFGVWLGWLPTSGAHQASSVLLPAISLSLLSMATFARITRTAVLDQLQMPYVRAARAKGLSEFAAVRSHVLRNSAIPVVTVAALEIVNLVTGAVIVETVFAWPGIGQLTVQSIAARDFPIVQGIVLLGAFASIFLNLLADVVYSLIDPRIRLGGSK